MKLFGKSDGGKIVMLQPREILKNPDQPRKLFQEGELRELAESLKSCGMIQPLTVRRRNEGYELVAGERRLRAAVLAGFREVPCLVTPADEGQAAVMALTENIQRKDLNFFEEAAAIAQLIAHGGLTQEQAAEKLGKSQPAIANKLRLLAMDDKCVATILEHGLTERHARALLKLPDNARRLEALEHIIAKKLNVEQTDRYIDGLQNNRKLRHTHILVRDVRILVNTIDRALSLVKKSGIETDCVREETDEALKMTIYIKKKVPKQISLVK